MLDLAARFGDLDLLGAHGVVDARSSALESADEIGRFVDQLLERSPAGISLSPNGDLQFVPESIAREKIARLGRSQTELAEVA